MSDSRYSRHEGKTFERMRVAVLSPMMYIEPDYVQSLADMIAFSWHHGLRIEKFAKTWRTVINWGRDDLARCGLKEKSPFSGKPFTHFLWLDADQVFKADLACQLARHNVDMVSALYYHRKGAPTPVVFTRNEKDPTGLKHFTLLEIPPTLVEVDAFGFGAVLMRREVLEKMEEPWFTQPWDCGEDIAFCVYAKKHGIKLHLDAQYTLGHVGDPPIIGPSTYRQWYEENKDRTAEFRIPIELNARGGKEND